MVGATMQSDSHGTRHRPVAARLITSLLAIGACCHGCSVRGEGTYGVEPLGVSVCEVADAGDGLAVITLYLTQRVSAGFSRTSAEVGRRTMLFEFSYGGGYQHRFAFEGREVRSLRMETGRDLAWAEGFCRDYARGNPQMELRLVGARHPSGVPSERP